MSHKPTPSISSARSEEPRFHTGDQVRAATNVSRHGFYVSGSVAQLGSVHEGVLEFPNLGDIPVRIRVRATDAQHTHCHFYDLSLKDQTMLMSLLERYEDGDEDVINDLSYDEIARGDGSKPMAQVQASVIKQKVPNGNGSAHAHPNGKNGHAVPVAAATQQREPQQRLPQQTVTMSAPKVSKSTASAQPAVKKSTGLIAMTVLLVGIATIGTLVYLFFRSQSSIPVQNAVLLGNYVPIKANAAGLVDDVFVREGDPVAKGTPLFRVVDQKVEGVYAETKATLVSAKMERDSAEKAVANAKKQFEIVAKSLSGDLAVAKAGVVLAETELKRAQSLANRLKPLLVREMIVQAKYDEAQMGVDAAVATLAMREAELTRLEERRDSLKGSSVLMVGDRVDQSLPLAESNLASADAKLAELEARLQHLETQRRGFTVTASQAGTVYASYLKKGSYVKVGGEVLAIGTKEESWAVGHVTQKMAMKVLPGQKVRVKMPALGVVEEGEVASVGHRGVYSQSGWNPDFRADPTLVPVKVTLPDMPYKIPAGLRIGMVIELEYEWPWDKKEPLLEEESAPAALANDSADQ